jgi:hypothetical protein
MFVAATQKMTAPVKSIGGVVEEGGRKQQEASCLFGT